MADLTLRQVAERLSVSAWTVRAFLNDAEQPMPHYRIGVARNAAVRVREQDLAAWQEARIARDTARDSGGAAEAAAPYGRAPSLPDIRARIAARGRGA